MVIQYVLILAFAAALVLTWRRARQGAIGRLPALGWSVFWIAAAVVVLRPETSSVLARFLGVGRGADVIVYFALVVAFALVFKLFTRLETLERQITRLVRDLALKGDAPTKHDDAA